MQTQFTQPSVPVSSGLESSPVASQGLDSKNFIIVFLILLLILTFLGINIASIFAYILDYLNHLFGPIIIRIASLIGYTAGTAINETSDIVTDTGKFGLDIIDGTAHSIGNILRGTTKPIPLGEDKNQLHDDINKSNIVNNEPHPDLPESAVQNPIQGGKAGWCLVGDYMGQRGCLEITKEDKCLSGQVFPTQKMCLNPTMTSNYEPPIRP